MSGIFHLFMNLLIKGVRIIPDLKESLLNRNTRIFAVHLRIEGNGLVILNKFIRTIKQNHKFGSLLARGHIKTNMLVICADNNHASAVDYVDLGHVVLLRQMNEILLCSVLRKCCCNFFCDVHQVSVRNIPNISAHIFHAGFQRIVYLGIRNLSLKRLGEKCCDTECQHHTNQKPTLERLCNVLFAAVVMLVLSAAFH